MTDPTFVRTRHEYDSYTDYWKLVELSGFPTCYVDEMNLHDSDATYIVSPMNGEFTAHLDWSGGKECVVYLWNLERPGGSGNFEQYVAGNLRYVHDDMVDVVLVSDRKLAKDSGFWYMPLGGHPLLGDPGDREKVHDYIHLMCYSLRRAGTGLFNYTTPWHKWYGFDIAPNGWGQERHIALQESKFMLNVHQDDTLYLEPLRFVLAAAYGLPIVTEQLADPYPYTGHVHQFDMETMSQIMHYALGYYEESKAHGEWMRNRMTKDLTFRHCLEANL